MLVIGHRFQALLQTDVNIEGGDKSFTVLIMRQHFFSKLMHYYNSLRPKIQWMDTNTFLKKHNTAFKSLV